MSDQTSPTPSTNSSDGVGSVAADALVIKQGPDKSVNSAEILATCRFINRRNGRCTVSVWYSTGGVSNATLNNQGDVWDLHVRDGDCYCWDWNGPCQANCSLRCSPGGSITSGNIQNPICGSTTDRGIRFFGRYSIVLTPFSRKRIRDAGFAHHNWASSRILASCHARCSEVRTDPNFV